MNRTSVACTVLAAVSLLGGCASNGPSPLPAGQEAYAVIPVSAEGDASTDAIAAGDRLSIRVFGEPEISGESYFVSSNGYIQVPLVGEVIAAGQSPRDLAKELQRRLSSKYVRDASVVVMITDRPQFTYTVEGDVTMPGVYPVSSSTTLLSAMAQAKSPTKTAKTDDIAIFRTVRGERTGGRFDLTAIRRGRAADPQIVAGDTIVVVNSATKSAWRDVLAAIPLLNTFVLIKQR